MIALLMRHLMANKYALLALLRLGDGDKALTNDLVTLRRVGKEWEWVCGRGFVYY